MAEYLPSSSLRVRAWSAEEFGASREDWDSLLAASDADPLFMSWDWQSRWWGHHATPLGASLRLAAVYAGARLVGLAPFYSHTAIVRGILRPRRLELIGIAWRNRHAVYSDYLDVIAARAHRNAVVAALGEWLCNQAFWDEIALCCTKRHGVASDLARQLSRCARVRQLEGMSAWRACLPSTFSEYLADLSPSVRRKMFNQRRKLSGPVLEHAGAVDIPEYLDALERYSAERWERDAPRGPFREFHLDIAACLARRGRLRLSRLVSRAGLLSVMYNVRAGNTMYYLQSGFDPVRAQNVSPGYLHFGYAIEAACSEGARCFDFLAGAGRHRDYKQDFVTKAVPVMTYHAVRGGLARALYAAYECMTGVGKIYTRRDATAQ